LGELNIILTAYYIILIKNTLECTKSLACPHFVFGYSDALDSIQV